MGRRRRSMIDTHSLPGSLGAREQRDCLFVGGGEKEKRKKHQHKTNTRSREPKRRRECLFSFFLVSRKHTHIHTFVRHINQSINQSIGE
mmetsp:Transcript_38875/g.54745  ORF Transcript_38875/g.54745 Transcript_38875/m.54745 type:complete len:89 (-) Transcript_38875:3-269(-)